MSENSEIYGQWYDMIDGAKWVAFGLTESQALLVSPTERAVIANQAREAERRFRFLADTLDLRVAGELRAPDA